MKNCEIQQVDKKQKKSIIKRVLFLCGFIYIGAILLSTSLIEPIRKCWYFKEAIGKYGNSMYFLASGLEYEVATHIGYSEERIELIPIDNYSEKLPEYNHTPDIILILNETCFDISLVVDVETDVDYMGQFYSMDNAIFRYAVVPKIGGGTNNSEYELLAFNSTYLLSGITPFQTFDMSDSTSIVSYLKELGYYTIVVHPLCKK